MIVQDYPVTMPKGVLVDEVDLPKVCQYKKWFIAKRGNVFANHYERLGVSCYRRRAVSLHRLIMGFPQGADVDHINGDPLDNRRANLRICSHKENSRNTKLSKNNSSGVNGVRWNSDKRKWVARIKHNYKTIFLGYFDDLESAASCRYAAATTLFGEYAGELRNG